MMGIRILLLTLLALCLSCFTAFSLPAGESPADPSTPPQVAPEKTTDVSSFPPAEIVPEIPEFYKYRVAIRLAFSDDPRLSLEDRNRLLDRVRAAVRRFWGTSWNVDVLLENRLQPPSLPLLEDLTPETVLHLDPDPHLDKVFVVVVENLSAQWHISARELDRRSRLLSPTRHIRTSDIREIPERLITCCSELFRPVALIEEVSGKTAYVRLLGGGLVPPDPGLSLPLANSLWLPVSRTIPSRRTPLEPSRESPTELSPDSPKQPASPTEASPKEIVQIAPWTYLRMVVPPTVDQPFSTCEIISGIRNPLPARKSFRVETLALAIRPLANATTVKLLSRGQSGIPLAAYDVDLMGEDKKLLTTILSDRQGRIELLGIPDRPLNWIQVRSGQQKIALLPIVPGAIPFLDLEIPSDANRQKVEARLAVMQARLMEIVVERAALMRLLKRIADEERWDEIDPVAVRLTEKLPARELLKAEVLAIRISEVKNATEMNDRLAASRIQKICDETLELIDRHLAEEKVKDLIELTLELRKTEQNRVRRIEENPEEQLKNLNPSK